MQDDLLKGPWVAQGRRGSQGRSRFASCSVCKSISNPHFPYGRTFWNEPDPSSVMLDHESDWRSRVKTRHLSSGLPLLTN